MSALEVTMMKRIGELNKQVDALQSENERLRKELADAQENYHIVNEMVAKTLKEGKPSV